MTCYFNSGMLLKQQGDSQGARGHFTSAYRMMDKMRHEAGVNFLDGTRLTTQCAAAQHTAMTCKPMHPAAVQNFSEIEKASREYLLGARNVGMKLEDLHKVFEGSSALLYTGMSVLVRLAQALIGPTTAEYSYRMFEDALDILVLSHGSNVAVKLEDADGGQFFLRNDDIGFPVFSGLFLLLLNNQVVEVDRFQRIVAVISMHMAYAAAKPEYEPHLILAYQNKLRLLESVVYMDAAALPAITTYTNTMWMYYDFEKHSKDLIHYYNSDRTANATSVLLKMLYMQGHFSQCDAYLERIKEVAFKIKHFFSSAVAVFAMYPIFLLCTPNSEAQIFMEKLVTREAKQMNKELSEPIQIFREALNLTIQHQQYARSEDDAVFDQESALVEGIVQSRSLVQREKNVVNLNLARRYYIGIEYVAARICYLKALRWELRAAATNKSNLDMIATCQDKAQSFLLLGLEHLSFTAEQDELNEQLLFAKANERLLRVQLLIKLIATCVDAEKARIMWTTALDNVEKTAQTAEKYNFQLLLLQAGMHLQTLAGLVLPPLSAPAAEPSVAQSNADPSGHATLSQTLQTRGAALESVARAYIDKVNKGSSADVDDVYRSILMQFPSE